MSSRSYLVAPVALVAIIGAYAVFLAAQSPDEDADRTSVSERPIWREAAWPFPVDQWGSGWAYRCKAGDCGVDVDLYLRPKIGFCNCKTGVADDEELDRVGDIDLVGTESSPIGAGHPIMVHWMKGRGRSYSVAAPSAKRVLSLAFNSRCDVIVATVIAGRDPGSQEQAVLQFLKSEPMRHWAEVVLGL